MENTSSSCVTLRIGSNDLLPDEITKLLNCEPTASQIKGQIITLKKSGKQITKKTGMWRLSTQHCEPANLDSQIVEIFQKLPDDLNVWQQLSKSYEIDMFCGLFLGKTNAVVSIAPEPMHLLSSLGVPLKLDIYSERSQMDVNE